MSVVVLFECIVIDNIDGAVYHHLARTPRKDSMAQFIIRILHRILRLADLPTLPGVRIASAGIVVYWGTLDQLAFGDCRGAWAGASSAFPT